MNACLPSDVLSHAQPCRILARVQLRIHAAAVAKCSACAQTCISHVLCMFACARVHAVLVGMYLRVLFQLLGLIKHVLSDERLEGLHATPANRNTPAHTVASDVTSSTDKSTVLRAQKKKGEGVWVCDVPLPALPPWLCSARYGDAAAWAQAQRSQT